MEHSEADTSFDEFAGQIGAIKRVVLAVDTGRSVFTPGRPIVRADAFCGQGGIGRIGLGCPPGVCAVCLVTGARKAGKALTVDVARAFGALRSRLPGVPRKVQM